MKKGNLSFGFNAVLSGQKSSVANATPMLIANSTKGKFTVTAPVTKFLGVAAGENIMFVSNLSGIESAIQAMTPEVVAAAKEMELDLSTAEGQKAFIEANVVWAIAKGEKLYNSNGTEKQAAIRMTAEDKKAYIEKNAEAIVEGNVNVLAARVLDKALEDVTEEDIQGIEFEALKGAISVDDIELKTVALSGAKTATTSNATGVGLTLGFTDNNIWNQIKSHLEEDARTTVNSEFKALLEDAFTTNYNNGYKEIEIKCVPVEFVEDKAPVVRTKKDAE